MFYYGNFSVIVILQQADTIVKPPVTYILAVIILFLIFFVDI